MEVLSVERPIKPILEKRELQDRLDNDVVATIFYKLQNRVNMGMWAIRQLATDEKN